MSNVEVVVVFEDIVGSSDFMEMDLYNIIFECLNDVKIKLVEVLDLMEFKDSF